MLREIRKAVSSKMRLNAESWITSSCLQEVRATELEVEVVKCIDPALQLRCFVC
jgi:hypothetical protein